MLARLVILLLAAGVASGCGDGGDGDESQALLDRLPSDSTMVAITDVADAREKLGLTEDADLFTGGSDNEIRLIASAAYALPHLQRPVNLPILEALDQKRVVAAASGGPEFDEQLTVVRTTQPPEEVLEGLEDEGYERDGELVVTDEPRSSVVYGAAAESDGLLLLASDDDVLRKALTEEDEDEAEAARLVREELEGPVRVVIANPDADCLEVLGIEDSLDPAGGQFLLDVVGETDPDRVALGEDTDLAMARVLDGTRFEDAEADGDLLRVPFSYDTDNRLPSPTGLVGGDLPSSTFYDCD